MTRRLDWDPKLETGFKDIDEQHRRIIERLSTLLEAIEEGRSPEVVVKLSDFLLDYTSRHFSTEEAIMKALDYPKFEEHKKHHDDFTIEMVKIMSAFADKKQPFLLLAKLGTRVVTWIHTHIQTNDAEMARWFREQGSTKSTG
jgi:hemerythrin